MLEMVLSIIQIAIEGITEFSFLGLFFDKKGFVKEKGKHLAIAGLVVLEFLISFLIQENTYLRFAVVIVCVSTYFFLFMKGKFLQVATLFTVFYSLTAMYEYIGLLVFIKLGITTGMEAPVNVNYMLVAFATLKIVICVVALLVMRGKQGKYRNISVLLSSKEWCGIFFSSIISLVILIVAFDKITVLDMNDKDVFFSLLGIGIACLDIAIIWLFTKVANRQQRILENEAVLNRVKNETMLYHSITENMEKQSRRIHEFNNRMTAIKSMLDQGKIEELQKYVDSIEAKIKEYPQIFNTKNAIVDAIMTAKYEEMVNNNILFVHKFSELAELKIADDDLVILLSNLLNNAIEACMKAEKKTIKMKFVVDERHIVLSVTNTFADKPSEMDGELVTSKDDELGNHGVGLKNVREIVEKYDGCCTVNFDDEWFFVAILIHR